MKKTTLLPLMALLTLFGVTAPVVAEESMDEMDKRCRSYAVEDGIPADEVEDYVKECIEGIMQEGSDSASESGSESEQETSKD